MNRLKKIVPLFILVAALSIAGIAATPAVLTQPAAPTAQVTSDGGEMVISWDSIPGAQFYTVGWVNWTEGEPVSDAGGDWHSLFHYTTVRGSETSYTVKGLNGGDDHLAIIRATDVDNRFGGGYSVWSRWSAAVQPERGISPTIDLQLREGNYLSVGDSATFGQYSVTVNSVAASQTISARGSDGTTQDRAAPYGRRWLVIYVHLDNDGGGPVTLTRGMDWFLGTELGHGFSWNSNRSVDQGHTLDTSLLFDVPQDATTAVLVIRPYTLTTSEIAPQLFRFNIPAP